MGDLLALICQMIRKMHRFSIDCSKIYAILQAQYLRDTRAVLAFAVDQDVLTGKIGMCASRYAISWRNKWMIRESDVVITYITHSWGGAAQFAEMAKKKRKRIINVAEMMNSESILQIRL